MSRHRLPAARRQRGFTLLEVLVAVTLLAMLGVMMYGGLRFGARAWETLGVRSERSAEVQAVQAFLRRQFAQAYPLLKESDRGDRQILFEGADTGMRFIGPVPTHLGVGGWYSLAIEAERNGPGERLMFRQAIYNADEEPFRFDKKEESNRVLLDGASSVSFSYFGAERQDDPPRWTPVWRESDHLPSLVRVELKFTDGDARSWPSLVAPLMVNSEAVCAISVRSARCRTRQE